MSPRRTHFLARLLFLALLVAVVGLTTLFATASAQPATPAATDAAGSTTAAPSPQAQGGTVEPPAAAVTATATITRTPTSTPTPTPTLTALQARLVLANTYLQGGDFKAAAELFAAIAADDRGNAAALTGLKAALDGEKSIAGTASAPQPTPAAPTATPVGAPPIVASFSDTIQRWGGVALAALLLLVIFYVLAAAVRRFLVWLREIWYLRGLPLFRRPALTPGYLLGEFTNAAGPAGSQGPTVVAEAITEKLIAWNQLVSSAEAPIEPAQGLDLGAMNWLKVLWIWILPPPRGHQVDGVLYARDGGDFGLSIRRILRAANRVDGSRTFAGGGPTPEAAFRGLGSEAAAWLLHPQDVESGETVRGVMGTALTSGEVFDRAMDLLLPVRRQVNQGAINFGDARQRLRDAEALLTQLPDGSQLRLDLTAVIADLSRSVPGV